MIMKYSN